MHYYLLCYAIIAANVDTKVGQLMKTLPMVYTLFVFDHHYYFNELHAKTVFPFSRRSKLTY